jgi:hypothetical protein
MHRLSALLLFVALALAGVAPVAAQQWEDYDYENLEFRGVGLEVGWVTPARVSSALLLGLRADLGYLGPNLRISPSLSFWSSRLRASEVNRLAEQIQSVCLRQRERVTECPLLELGDIRMSDLALNVDAFYEFPNTPFLFIPYAGLGGGLHFLNSRGELINDTFIEDFLDSLAPGINGVGGLRIPLTETFEVLAEARYMLASEIRYGGLSLGASWLFPVRGTPASPPQARSR